MSPFASHRRTACIQRSQAATYALNVHRSMRVRRPGAAAAAASSQINLRTGVRSGCPAHGSQRLRLLTGLRPLEGLQVGRSGLSAAHGVLGMMIEVGYTARWMCEHSPIGVSGNLKSTEGCPT